MTTGERKQVSAITTGVDRVRRSLLKHRQTAANYDGNEALWDTRYVATPPAELDRRRMVEFDYREHELSGISSFYDDVAMAGPLRLLTDDGIAALADICARLDAAAVHNDYVVTRRLRNVEHISPFVHDMVRDPAFLKLASAIVGVPLVPHPIRDAGVQINYYTASASEGGNEVAKWHVDGMNYVFTMTLTDHKEHDGGDYIYYQGHRADFELNRDEVTMLGEAHPRVRKANFQHAGDTMFTRGSHVYHAVTPVTRGARTTFAVSLFCPELGGADQNRFWHSAPDDGFIRTLKNWTDLYRAIRAPERYRMRNGIPKTSRRESVHPTIADQREPTGKPSATDVQ